MIMQEMSKIKNKYKILFDTYTVPVYTYWERLLLRRWIGNRIEN